MTHHSTLDQLAQLRFHGMAHALRDQLAQPEIERLSFTERLGLLLDHEISDRASRSLTARLRRAKLHQKACMEDIDYRSARGLDQRQMLQLASCQWVRRRQNVLITGPTGVGKSYVACALAHKACLENFRTHYYRLHRLLETLQLAREDRTYLRVLKQLARINVLLLDDWGLHGISRAQQRDLMELVDDRYTLRSTIVTSQYPIDKWHQTMEDPTLADAILDRLVNNAHKIQLTGDSMRKVQGEQELIIESTKS